MQGICNPEKINIAVTPIKITREDLHKSIELEYLGNKAGDATKIKFVARELSHFFRDSSVNKTLIEERDTSYKTEIFLNSLKDKKNYFIYSSDENLKVNDKEVYHSVKELQTAISQFICEGLPSKIVVIYEPYNRE